MVTIYVLSGPRRGSTSGGETPGQLPAVPKDLRPRTAHFSRLSTLKMRQHLLLSCVVRFILCGLLNTPNFGTAPCSFHHRTLAHPRGCSRAGQVGEQVSCKYIRCRCSLDHAEARRCGAQAPGNLLALSKDVRPDTMHRSRLMTLKTWLHLVLLCVVRLYC